MQIVNKTNCMYHGVHSLELHEVLYSCLSGSLGSSNTISTAFGSIQQNYCCRGKTTQNT